MRSLALASLLALLSLCAACEAEQAEPDAELEDDGAPPSLLTSSGQLVLEDAHDEDILRDQSNLRPANMGEDDYLRLRQTAAREEFHRTWPYVKVASREDLDLVESRWYARGSGVVVQNHSERWMYVYGRFTSTADPDCTIATAWQPLGPISSAMITAPEGKCTADNGVLTIKSKQGFFLGTIHVTKQDQGAP